MKAKLIKVEDGYELFTQGFLKGSTNHGLIESLNIEEGPIRYKLSPKNCQAIERGYDLDELAKHCSKQEYYDWGGEVFEQDYLDTRYTAYKQGFQKCLELMGDKKFSEDDMKAAYGKGFSKQGIKSFNLLIQSLQQTEWDVEIEMGGYRLNDDGEIIGFPSYELPKLDADECLILKRI